MIAENKAEFDKAGITAWHEAGYFGQGITIAVLDADPYIPDYMKAEGVYFDPLGVDDGKGGSNGHTADVAKVIHEVAPQAKIHLFPHLSGADYVQKHASEYQLINHSMSGLADRAVRGLNIPVTQAAGNGGSDTAWPTEQGAPFIIVGAWEEYREMRASYSNGGEGLDCVAYTNIATPTKYGGRYHTFNGTSASAPFVCGMLALVMSKVGALNGEAARNFVLANCRDLEEPGKDIRTGCGLFILPPPEEVSVEMEIVMQLGDKNCFVNGEPYVLDVAPKAENGRTLVPLRFIAEAFGCKVDWDGKTKTIHIEGGGF